MHNWVLWSWSPFGIVQGSPGSCALGIAPSWTWEALVLLLLRCCLKPGHLSCVFGSPELLKLHPQLCKGRWSKNRGGIFNSCLPQVFYLSAFRILEWFPVCQNRFHLLNFATLKNMELAKQFCHFWNAGPDNWTVVAISRAKIFRKMNTVL